MITRRMSPVSVFLVSIAAVFVLGAIGEIVFRRTNVPDVLWLIGAGVVIGPGLGLVTREQLAHAAPFFAAITLVVVLFEGGTQLRASELASAAPRSLALALSTFGVTVAVVAGVSNLMAKAGALSEEWTWLHGAMLGCITGGSSSIIIMPSVAQARVEARVANLVGLESALTDAFCVVGTAALVDILAGRATDANPGLSLARSFGIGLGMGLVAGFSWLLLLRRLRDSSHAYPLTLAALMLLYVAADRAGGSAAFCILTVSIILGNARAIAPKLGLDHKYALQEGVQGFHSQVTFIVKSFFFTFIGAMLGPPWSLIGLGVVLGLVLLLARLPGTYLSTIASGLDGPRKALVAISLPRGMAAGVLSTLPATAGVPGTAELPVLVFASVVTTIVVFAAAFPLVRRRMA